MRRVSSAGGIEREGGGGGVGVGAGAGARGVFSEVVMVNAVFEAAEERRRLPLVGFGSGFSGEGSGGDVVGGPPPASRPSSLVMMS